MIKSLDKIKSRIIKADYSLLDAMRKMDELDCKSLMISNDGSRFDGIVSIGDVQRAILAGKSLDTNAGDVIRINPTIASQEHTQDQIEEMMLQKRMEFLPVVDPQGQVVEVHFWDELFKHDTIPPKHNFNHPVVIMAGGQGSRLKPLTNVLPKPLIPIGEVTMLEEIFGKFERYGCNRFFISLNYKADLIEYYVNSLNLPLDIQYFRETKPLGTAGSLSLIKDQLNETFFVNNCDILIEQDYSEILEYHKEHDYEITLVSVVKSLNIPYGTVETGENGKLISMSEKPNHAFQINSGMYLIEPHLLDEVPEDRFFHITELIEKVRQRNGRVGVFPVSENAWRDIGNWKEYLDKIEQ